MSTGEVGIVVHVAISVITAVVAHWRDRRFVRAWVTSTVVATLLFQIGAFFQAGQLDPFFVVAVIVSGASTALISAAIGGVFVLLRRRSTDALGEE